MLRLGERDVKIYNAEVSRKKQTDIGIVNPLAPEFPFKF